MTEIEERLASSERDAENLQEQVIAFIRSFGLLRPDNTPCGQPLSVSEAHALRELSRLDGCSQTELGNVLQLEKSTISRLVNQLKDKGWVERDRDPDDGRAVRLRLTAQGQRVAGQVAASRAAYFARIVEGIPPTERDGVITAFQTVVKALESNDQSAGDGSQDERFRP
ncbi:MAG: MarR family transcriptional regulator [Chloroflexia bacterium]|nr:MarR family transcriptional regulator [Chloroflexia bacterium]